MSGYDLEDLNLPVLSGASLRIFARLLRAPFVGRLLLRKLVADAGIPQLNGALLDCEPTFFPWVSPSREQSMEPAPGEPTAIPMNRTGFVSIRDHQHAYQSGRTTPLEVAHATLAAIEKSDSGPQPLRAIIAASTEEILRQAEASTQRYREGRPRGPFDGVPIGVKDELDLVPYPTKVGTSFLGSHPASEDATVVRRLREAGALLFGKTNMYEIGISAESHNLHHGTVRNPYDLEHQAGGSSSGSAAAVSAGLFPMAVGADGGGSIRVPAAFCGVVGLKGTFGRFSEFGAAPLCWSLAHVGPIAATTDDVALSYQVMAGPDPKDPHTWGQPPLSVGDLARTNLKGVTVGIYRPWFEHAEPDIVQACDAMLEHFRAAGATIKSIDIPRLDLMRVAQAVSILSEMAAAMEAHVGHFSKHAPAVQINLLAGREFRARHYVISQRVRTLAMQTFAAAFERVDTVITPTTAVTAPRIIESSGNVGWSNINSLTQIMRYVFVGNLTGHPAISFPVGYDSRGLPIGMQAMARHWDEALLLRLSWVAEQHLERRIPALHFRALREE